MMTSVMRNGLARERSPGAGTAAAADRAYDACWQHDGDADAGGNDEVAAIAWRLLMRRLIVAVLLAFAVFTAGADDASSSAASFIAQFEGFRPDPYLRQRRVRDRGLRASADVRQGRRAGDYAAVTRA